MISPYIGIVEIQTAYITSNTLTISSNSCNILPIRFRLRLEKKRNMTHIQTYGANMKDIQNMTLNVLSEQASGFLRKDLIDKSLLYGNNKGQTLKMYEYNYRH